MEKFMALALLNINHEQFLLLGEICHMNVKS